MLDFNKTIVSRLNALKSDAAEQVIVDKFIRNIKEIYDTLNDIYDNEVMAINIKFDKLWSLHLIILETIKKYNDEFGNYLFRRFDKLKFTRGGKKKRRF